ncbi:MAG TPA: site-specific integrase [Chitinophaga sp.]|uniref:site-specific integrase n=1 Tax=Chitinophaga sp. TaxID=1869181 RepID=UPI002B8F113B|nr:site-specific integrase [Chitinophaga sp.]HVI43497.1 site-specific integrase [Chitinophaga sp.]
MEIKLYLKRPEATTPTGIFARITYEHGRFKYYLPEKINPAYWNPKTHRTVKSKDFPEFSEFNDRLDNIEKIIKNTRRKFMNDNDNTPPSPPVFRDLLDTALGRKEIKKAETFFSYFEDFNNRSEKGERISPKTKRRTSPNTNKGYVTTLNHLKDFQATYKRKIDFDNIDVKFHSDYVSYLTSTVKLGINTIGDHIKRIITIMAEAKSRGIPVCNDFETDYFFKPQEETDSIYLNEQELKLIEQLDLSNDLKLDRTRDLFLIGCYTGLRYSDYSILSPEHIKGGYIEIRQTKTTGKVVIPVHPVIQGILNKYNEELPRVISNQKMNDYLKDIGKKVKELHVSITISYTKGGERKTETQPKFTLISTHTARRSFATNEYLAGTPVVTIMAITGHKTEKAFLRYIKLTPAEHAKLLKQHWETRQAEQNQLNKIKPGLELLKNLVISQ